MIERIPMIERILERQIVNARSSILLLGPRQTGKTTLLSGIKADLTVNLASERVYQECLGNPGYLEDLVETKEPKLVFIDEVQRLPTLLNTVQALIDERKIRFLLTGSSARKLKRGQANLLPGRVINKRLFPITLRELDFKIDTKDALRWGFLPGILSNPDLSERRELLSSYSANYLVEEIQQEALTRNLAGYSRFIQRLPEWAGRVLDYSKISTKNKLNRFAVHRFFEIFEDTLLGQRIGAFSLDAGIPLVKHPKFYFFDNGVMNGITRQFDPALDYLGACCETIVFNQLLAGLSYMGYPFDIAFFRTHSGIEVDFIVSRGRELFAIEVKSSDRLADDDVKPLLYFKGLQKSAKLYLFHFGRTAKKLGGVWCLPWVEGIKEVLGK